MYYYTPRAGCIEIGAPWDNNSSSYANNSPYTVTIYVNHGCGGFFSQSVDKNNGWLIEGYEFNDTASSLIFRGA